MINFNDYPFINISMTFYFRVRNAKMWGGEGSVGYMSCAMEECVNLNSVTAETIENIRTQNAEQLGVTAGDVDFITKAEYDEATSDNDDEDEDDDDDGIMPLV